MLCVLILFPSASRESMETVKSGRLPRSAAADSALNQTAPNETALYQTALNETALVDSALMETALSSVAEPVLPSALKSPQLGRSTCRCSTLFHCSTIGSGSASIRINLGKNNHKNREKKVKKFNVLTCWMFFLRAEDFSLA
jgi:hypothetical protein